MLSMIEVEKRVIDAGLCTSCGACQGMCPYFRSFAGRTIPNFTCNRESGRCAAFCPRMPVDLAALQRQFFTADTLTRELGPLRALYVTRAADPQLRQHSQHGGTMSALVALALREGFIDGAVLSRADGVLEPQGVLVTDADEVAKCAGVSFQIPPTLAQLNQELEAGRCTKLGLVGTPCKTLAAYKMKARPYADNDNHAGRIAMVFGLFCGWGLDWQGLEQLVQDKAAAARHCDILPSAYQCMELRQDDGSVVKIGLDAVKPLVRDNCRYCADMTSELADLSVGGARTAAGWPQDQGWNQLIVRSEQGEKLVELARAQGVLEFGPLPEQALDKLKAAALHKKQAAAAALEQRFGDLAYLEPSRTLVEEWNK